MLKVFVIFVIFFSCITAQSVIDKDMMVKLLSYENEHGTEQYNFKYELSDGQTREEVGVLMNKGTPEEELVVMGMYSFVGDDNKTHMTMYRADKNGYQPKYTVSKSDLVKSLLG